MPAFFTALLGILIKVFEASPVIIGILIILGLVVGAFFLYHSVFIKPQNKLILRSIEEKFMYGISQVTGGIKAVEDVVKAYKDNEDLKHKQIEEKMDDIKSIASSNNLQLLNLADDMNTYKILNHEVLTDEMEKISAVIYYSATAVSNILSNFVIEFRSNPEKNNGGTDELLFSVTKDVQRDRLKYHTELLTQGVSPRTIQLWEETEGEMFERFAFWIIQFYDKFKVMKGNGAITELIKTEAGILKDRFYREFMRVFKSKLSIKE